MNKGSYSISLAQSNKIALEHDLRRYTPPNADKALSDRNIYVVKTEDIKSEFNELFREAIEEYNKNQPRDSRKKTLDYFSELTRGSQHERALYEMVIQIGNNEDNGITDNDFDVEHWQNLKQQGKFKSASQYALAHLNKSETKAELKEVLLNVAKKLPEQYPALKFWNICLHDDEVEGTAHLHVIFSPIGTGYKNGVQRRCSLSKALESMGFKTTVGNNYAITQFQNSVKDNVEKEMSLYGYARQFMNNHEKHLSVSQFKLKTENEKLLKKKDELNAEKDLLSLNVRQKQAKNAELDEQARRIRTAQRQLKELQAELETKEKALAKREAELAQREKLLQDSNAVLKYREKALNKRERALRANEYVDKNIQTPQTQRPDRALPSFCE